MPCIANYFIVDGKKIPVKDFQISELEKGISIYEVIKISNYSPLFFDEHLKRFHQSAEIKNLKISISDKEVKKQVLKLIEINKIKNGRLKFVIRFYGRKNTLICFFLQNIEPKADVYEYGVKIISEKIERIDPNAKVINYKLREFLKSNTKNKNVFETLLISKNNKITECSKSNIFFIKNNKLTTPKSRDVLKGITRDFIFKICNKKNIKVLEKDIFLKEIANFDAAFITGTSIGVLAVNQINTTHFSTNNEILKIISENYFKIIKN